MENFDLKKYIASPKKYLDSISLDVLVAFLEKANYMYRNTQETLVSDELFDYAFAYLEQKDPNHPFLTLIGAPVDRKKKLPVWMGSQDKIRDDPKALLNWQNKYKPPYILSDKLDGISGLIVYDKKGKFSIYTRGDGEYGQIINGILPYIRNDKWSFDKPIIVRGEFIISKKNWNSNKHIGANARNVVAGLLNSKRTKSDIAKLADFIAYELIEPQLPYHESLEYLASIGLNVVNHQIIDQSQLNLEYLSEHLIKRRDESLYEIDGIVVRDNAIYPNLPGKNPKYSFAFKTILTHEQAEVVVSHVEWNISKDGFLKPTVHFNAVHIGGVQIQKASGHNASYIYSNNIGPGSKIVIIRSGDVIPKIIRILTPSATGKPDMPDIPFIWNETGVDIMIKKSIEHDDIKIRQLENFVNTLNIMNIGEGIVKKLFDSGIKTIAQFVALKKEDFLLLEGVKEKGAEKMSKSLRERLDTVTCEELMVASNLFGRGFGLKRIKIIVDANPEILQQKLMTKLNPVKSIGEKTMEQFIDKLPMFYEFLKEIGFKCKTTKKDSKETTKEAIFKDKTLVFTGFRNKEWETLVESLGGKMGSSVSKSTFLVVAADMTDTAAKAVKGKELGILISKEDFIKKYKGYGF
jgi:NAD-dependent DNA ligase